MATARRIPAPRRPRRLPKPVEDVIVGGKQLIEQGKAAVETLKRGVRTIKKSGSR